MSLFSSRQKEILISIRRASVLFQHSLTLVEEKGTNESLRENLFLLHSDLETLKKLLRNLREEADLGKSYLPLKSEEHEPRICEFHDAVYCDNCGWCKTNKDYEVR